MNLLHSIGACYATDFAESEVSCTKSRICPSPSFFCNVTEFGFAKVVSKVL